MSGKTIQIIRTGPPGQHIFWREGVWLWKYPDGRLSANTSTQHGDGTGLEGVDFMSTFRADGRH